MGSMLHFCNLLAILFGTSELRFLQFEFDQSKSFVYLCTLRTFFNVNFNFNFN